MPLAQQEEQHIHDLDERIEGIARGLHRLDAGKRPLDARSLRHLQSTLEELRAAEATLVEEHRELIATRERLSEERRHYRQLFAESREACIVTDAAGVVTEANQAAAELAHRDPARMAGQPIASLLLGAGNDRIPQLLARVRRDRLVDDVRLKLRRADKAWWDVTACLCMVRSDGAASIAWRLRDAGEGAGDADPQRRSDALSEIEHANAIRDEILGLISHELKTPIAVIAGNAEVLARRDGMLAPEQRAVALADIRGEAARLHRTVDNMLVLARLERGQQIGRAPTDLVEIVRQRVDQHQVEWPERRFVVDLAGSLPPLDASAAYVSQALRNLMTNAEQHSPADTPITIRAREDGSGVQVSVIDHGAGVPEDEIELLFGPFHRASGGGPAPARQGVGVGLAVSRRLIEEQQGRLWAERREGDGMAFSFWLPAHDGSRLVPAADIDETQ